MSQSKFTHRKQGITAALESMLHNIEKFLPVYKTIFPFDMQPWQIE